MLELFPLSGENSPKGGAIKTLTESRVYRGSYITKCRVYLAGSTLVAGVICLPSVLVVVGAVASLVFGGNWVTKGLAGLAFLKVFTAYAKQR